MSDLSLLLVMIGLWVQLQCKMVSAVIAYNHPQTRQVYMLVLHQAILILHMHVDFLSTMQLRSNDICVNDEPKFMALNPMDDHNAITIMDPKPGDNDIMLQIPLTICGTVTYFPCWQPTLNEYQQTDQNFVLT